jgi:hypothetical protein
VRWLELVARLQPRAACRGGAYHGAEMLVGLEIAARGERVLVAAVVQLVEEVGRSAYHAKLVVRVAQAQGNRSLDAAGKLAFGEFEIVRIRNVLDGPGQVINRVEHQVEPSALGAHHDIVAQPFVVQK